MLRSDIASLFLVASGANRLHVHFLAGPGFPILAYHEVSGKVLEAHLKALRPHYRFSSIADALAGQRPSKTRRPIVLTFDDGYASWSTEVVPVLQRHNIPALFFPCTAFLDRTSLPWYEVVEAFTRARAGDSIRVQGHRFQVEALERNPRLRRKLFSRLKSMDHETLLEVIDGIQDGLLEETRETIRERYLSWDALQQIADSGFEIGAHSQTHPILARLPLDRAREEIVGSKKRLEAVLGYPVRYFAYPNGGTGDLNETIVAEVKRAGFDAAFCAFPGWNPPGTDPFLLRRAVVAPGGSIWRLLTSASGLLGHLENIWRKVLD